MNFIYRLSLLSSFIGLWITSLLPERFELFIGFLLIFTFGMVHGSNDLLIVKILTKKDGKTSFLKILITYLIVIFFVGMLFYLYPSLALILFIIFSAYHFGEQHWETFLQKCSLNLRKSFFLAYGLFILNLLFFFNAEDVLTVTQEICGYKMEKLYSAPILLGLAFCMLIFMAYSLYHKKIQFQLIVREIFILLVLTLIFKMSTLIWGFAIYFIFWHSIPSLIEQTRFLFKSFDTTTLIKYVKSAFPYWIISLLGILILYVLLGEQKHFYSLFFAFIAAVTFPHAIIMIKMFDKKKHKP